MSIQSITKETFQAAVIESEKPVVIEFWASWCGPCRQLAPVVDSIAEATGDKAVFGKINVDEQPELASKYQISSIPAVMIFKDGNPVDGFIGVQPRKSIENLLASHL